MYIHLKWNNVNTQSVTTNIYRSLTTIDRANPGTPLVTLDGAVLDYYDRTVTSGTTYYYVLEFVNGTNKVASRNYQFTAQYMRGHGNSLVIFGDDHYGYMGYWTLPSFTSVLSMLGVNRETSAPSYDAPLDTYKYSINGKVYNLGVVASSFIDVATALTFLKRTDKLPLTIDGINYLAYPVDCRGADYVWTTQIQKPQAGDTSFSDKLILPLISNRTLTGRAGEALGNVFNHNQTNVWLSKTSPEATLMTNWQLSTNNVSYSNGTNGSTYFVFVLELVE